MLAGLAIALLALRITPVDPIFYVIFAAALGALAGWLIPARSIVAGVAAIVIATLAWSGFVLGRAFVAGEFARVFPDCDPCGFNGYLARVLIGAAMLLAAYGPLAGVFGWLGSVARARLVRA